MNIPPGYRILGPDEVIQEGDCYWSNDVNFEEPEFKNRLIADSNYDKLPICDHRIGMLVGNQEYLITRKENKMSEETLTINKARVLEAASKCKDVKRVMKTLWPEIFEPKVTLFKLGDILNNAGPKFMVVRHTNNTYHGVHLTGSSGQVYVHNEEYESLEDMSHAWKHMKVIGNIKDKISS